MRLTIQKWGNSLALRIPAAAAQESGIKQGSSVDLTVGRNTLILKVIRRRKQTEATLDELLAKVTPQNRHALVDIGPAVGREVVAE